MELFIAGNVQTILNGKVTQNSLYPVSVTRLPYALGGAAISKTKKPLSIGEAIIYEAVGHIYVPSSSFEETTKFDVAFLMGIKRKPKDLITVKTPQSIARLYQDLVKIYTKGFAIIGNAFFSSLAGAYLKLSPIYNENINTHISKYWETEEIKNQATQLFGVVLPQPDERAFYTNPNEKVKDVLPSHTHVLTPNTRHLRTQSEITSAQLWVEGITQVITYTD